MRGFSWCKGVMQKVKLVGRFKVFLRDSCLKKIIYFGEKLVHIKYKMEDFKTALLKIFKTKIGTTEKLQTKT